MGCMGCHLLDDLAYFSYQEKTQEGMMMEYDDLKRALETNIELTKQLKIYNNHLAGTKFFMILISVILIVMMMRFMGWI